MGHPVIHQTLQSVQVLDAPLGEGHGQGMGIKIHPVRPFHRPRNRLPGNAQFFLFSSRTTQGCLLYTSDAADE